MLIEKKCLQLFVASNTVGTKIGMQHRRQFNAIGSLVILQQAGYDAWQRERAAVQLMQQLHLSFFILEANLHPVGLV